VGSSAGSSRWPTTRGEAHLLERQSLAIDGNKRQSTAINGNQWTCSKGMNWKRASSQC